MKKHHWALISLGVNLTQALAKFVAGLLTGSLSMLGEAVHSLSDSFASVVAFITIKLSDKKTERFPYGLYKLENIGSIVIAFFLLLAAYEMVKRAVGTRVEVKEEYLSVGLVVAVFSLVSSLSLSLLERRAGKRLGSPTLVADSYHTLTDAFGSFLVLVSFLSVYVGYQLDRYFALGVALLITYTALGILWREVSVLLDVSVDERTAQRVREVLLSFPEVKEIKGMFLRSSGGKIFGDLILVIEGRDFFGVHRLVDRIEERLKQEVPELEMVFIHYEPTEGYPSRVGVLINEKGQVSESFLKARELWVFGGQSPERLKLKEGDEERVCMAVCDKDLQIVVSGHHPTDPKAKSLLSQKGVFVWETEEKNPYLALKEVVYNLEDVQAPDKERARD